MARVLDKEKMSFLGSLALGGLLAGIAAMSSTVSHDLAFGSGGGGTHAALEPPGVPFVASEFGRYWQEGGANPFTLVSDRRDLPPSDIPLPPVPPSPIEAFPPTPWPAGDAGPWGVFASDGPSKPAFTLGPEFESAELTKLLPPPPAAAAGDAGQADATGKEDVVMRKNGSQLRGKIESETDAEVVIKTKGGTQHVPKADVLSVTYGTSTPKETYQREAKKIEPGDADGHQKQAEYCEKNGLAAEALAEWEAVLKADPKRLAVCEKLGDLYRRAMDLDGELGLYRRVTAAGGTGVEKLWIRMGKLFAQLGLFDDAVAAYEGGVKAFPVALDPKIELSLALARVGRYDEAADTAERAERQGNGDPRCAMARGLIAFARGNDADADKFLPAVADAQDLDVLLARGVLSFRAAQKDASKLADAAAAFRKAVTVASGSSDAWVDLGLCLLLAGKNVEAELCFKTADDMDPSSSRAACGLGLIALLGGKADDAAARFSAARKRDPSDPYPRYALGKVQIAQAGSIEDGWKSLLAASKLGGRNTDLSVTLGLAALAKQDHADAIAFLENAMRAGTPSADLRAALGIAYLGRGDGKAAFDSFREALKTDGANTAALNGLGYYYYFGRQGAEAGRQFDKVLAKDAQNAYATDAKAKVQETTTRTLWEDTFQRDDNESVGRGWVQIQRSGVKITLGDKKVKFTGKQGIKDDEMTSLERPIKLKTFLRFEVEIDTTELGEAAAGVRLLARLDDAGRQGGILFERNEKGKWAFCVTEDLSTLLSWTEVPGGPEEPVFRIALERVEAQQGQTVFKISVGDKVITSPHADSLGNMENAMVGVFGSAPSGTAWTLYADSVRIIERKPDARKRGK